jgi:ribosome-binding ATPase YchF (GTP1/OBG family)
MKVIIYHKMKAQREVEVYLYPYTTTDPGEGVVVKATPSLHELSFLRPFLF